HFFISPENPAVVRGRQPTIAAPRLSGEGRRKSVKRIGTDLETARPLRARPGRRGRGCPPRAVATGALGAVLLKAPFHGTLRRDPSRPRAAMKRVINWLLALLALAALAVGALAQTGVVHLAA